MYRKIHVYDIDGVLVDSSHRYRNTPAGNIDLEYWMANRTKENIAKDTLLPHVVNYRADVLNSGIYTVLCTSRMWNIDDINFINSRLGKPDYLIMRPVGNMEPDAKLKRIQLLRLRNLKQFKGLPAFLWEDNKKNISALTDLFTNCFFVQSHIKDFN